MRIRDMLKELFVPTPKEVVKTFLWLIAILSVMAYAVIINRVALLFVALLAITIYALIVRHELKTCEPDECDICFITTDDDKFHFCRKMQKRQAEFVRQYEYLSGTEMNKKCDKLVDGDTLKKTKENLKKNGVFGFFKHG